MCAAVNAVLAGNPVKVPRNDAVAEVMLLALSRVTTSVIVICPLPVDSALVIAGTSFAGRISTLNVGFDGVGVVGFESLPHPAAARHTAAHITNRRFITSLL